MPLQWLVGARPASPACPPCPFSLANRFEDNSQKDTNSTMSYIDEYAHQGAPAKTAASRPSKPHKHIQPDRVWLVLARRAYEEPLRQVGTVEAADREPAIVYARSIYAEF